MYTRQKKIFELLTPAESVSDAQAKYRKEKKDLRIVRADGGGSMVIVENKLWKGSVAEIYEMWVTLVTQEPLSCLFGSWYRHRFTKSVSKKTVEAFGLSDRWLIVNILVFSK